MNKKHNKKIIDLPSYAKTHNEFKGAHIIGRIIKVLGFLGVKNKKINAAFEKLPNRKEIEHLLSVPDRFNTQFSTIGWIAHESMSFPTMEKALELAENGNKEKAEILLANHFTSTEIKWLRHRFKVLPQFSIRYNLIERAYLDTLEKRYYSVVPLLLIIIDGVVNDISKSKGFFADNTEIKAWDSIAAHSSGLTAIKNIFNASRKKTNQDEIFLPYRNGILHGRDINFGNKFVVGKCWSTMFAINDWARALKDEKENPPVIEKQLSFKESLKELNKTLIEHAKWKKEHKITLQKLEDWKPRINPSIAPETFKKFSPEKEAYNIAENWKNKNYGKIAKQIHRFSDKEINISVEAGKVRNELQNKILKKFQIIRIKDEAPAISEITMRINYEINSEEKEADVVMRMICKSPFGEIGINGDDDLAWEFIDNFFFKLDFQ
jgi:hypothetical protein